MLITRELDYAMRTLRALHRHGLLSAGAVAELEHMPKAITLKLLKQLSAAGLVASRRGAAGGYRLARNPAEMTIYDILDAVGERILVNRCQQPGYLCENNTEHSCGLCVEFGHIQQVLDNALRRAPLGALFEPSEPMFTVPLSL